MLRIPPLRLAVRWMTLVAVALVVGFLAPGHQHEILPRTIGAHAPHESLASCCLQVLPDPAEPECELCGWKDRTPMLPAALPPAPPRPVAIALPAPAVPRAPPLPLVAAYRTRAPPSWPST